MSPELRQTSHRGQWVRAQEADRYRDLGCKRLAIRIRDLIFKRVGSQKPQPESSRRQFQH